MQRIILVFKMYKSLNMSLVTFATKDEEVRTNSGAGASVGTPGTRGFANVFIAEK